MITDSPLSITTPSAAGIGYVLSVRAPVPLANAIVISDARADPIPSAPIASNAFDTASRRNSRRSMASPSGQVPSQSRARFKSTRPLPGTCSSRLHEGNAYKGDREPQQNAEPRRGAETLPAGVIVRARREANPRLRLRHHISVYEQQGDQRHLGPVNRRNEIRLEVGREEQY